MKTKAKQSDKRYFILVKDMDCHNGWCFSDTKPRSPGAAFKEVWPEDYEDVKEEFDYRNNSEFDVRYLVVDLQEHKLISCDI